MISLSENEAHRQVEAMPPVNPQEEDIDFWKVSASILRQRRAALVAGVLVLGIGVAVILSQQEETYVASASFVAQSSGSSSMGALAGLAAQYGVAVPGGASAEGPQFYADLLETRLLLSRVAEQEYAVETEEGPIRTALIDFIPSENMKPAFARNATIEWLRRNLDVSVDRVTGVVELEFTAPQPELAQQVASEVLRQINEYNISTRQSRAAAERRFVEERLEDLRAELTAAERELQHFLRQNRTFENSPELVFEHQRLQREVTSLQQVVTSLTQAAEQAKIEEVRNLPVVTVLEQPEVPVRPRSGPLLNSFVVVALLAAIIALAAAFIAEFLERGKEAKSSSYKEFQRAWSQTRADLLRPFRKVN